METIRGIELTGTEQQELVLQLRYIDREVRRFSVSKDALLQGEEIHYRNCEFSEEDIKDRLSILDAAIPDDSRWYWDGVRWHNITAAFRNP